MNQNQTSQQSTTEAACYYQTTVWWQGTSQEDAQHKVNKIIAQHKQPVAAQYSPLMNALMQFTGGFVSHLVSKTEWHRNIRKGFDSTNPKEQNPA